MKTSPEYPPAYRPADFVRGYDRATILDHVGECLELYDELADGRADGIPPEIAPNVFAVIQTMVASVEPSPEKLRELESRARLNGAGVGDLSLGRG